MNHDRDPKTTNKWHAIGRALAWLGFMAVAFLLLWLAATRLTPHLEQVFMGPPTPTPTATPTPPPPKAAIVDQIGFSFPSPAFMAEAEEYLEEAGYRVDVHAPEAVTLDFYRTLPQRGYHLILCQSHATSEVLAEGELDREGRYPPGPFLFTTEIYEEKRYPFLQMADQIRAGKLFYEDSPDLFLIGPNFVRQSMQGHFEGTVIILGGCQGLAVPDLAQALVDRGASAVIGWDGMVDLSHNNRAVLRLLEVMTVDGRSPRQAVEQTMEEVGPDPTYGSSLSALPHAPSQENR